mmetsp:Transcript_95819/g.254476  ORF Transcript_95819/g.254476 Transcript_95819/m.254476 type:complete len:239 (+) Transcript_95819:609-1325(+)
MRNSQTSQCPFAAAFISEFSPFSVTVSARTPYWLTSMSQMSRCPARAAHINTVQPSSSLRSKEAPSSSNSFTTSHSPCSAAFMRAVTPSSSLASSTRFFSFAMVFCASPPPRGPALFFCAICASMRYWMMSGCPSLHAFISAVSPVSSLKEILAPFSTRYRTTGRHPPMAACINALTPSGSFWSTLTFGSSSARPHASTEPAFAASIKGLTATVLDFPWLLFSAASKLLVIAPNQASS